MYYSGRMQIDRFISLLNKTKVNNDDDDDDFICIYIYI